MVHYKRKKARKQQNCFGTYKEITKCRSGRSFFSAAFFKERSVYIILILTHLHLHGGRISGKLLSPEVVKEEKNTGSKSNGVGNFKYRKSTGDISGHLLINLLKSVPTSTSVLKVMIEKAAPKKEASDIKITFRISKTVCDFPAGRYVRMKDGSPSGVISRSGSFF